MPHVSTMMLTLSMLAVASFHPTARPTQESELCKCHPDTYLVDNHCADVTQQVFNLGLLHTIARCHDDSGCYYAAVPCVWDITMALRTGGTHDFSALKDGAHIIDTTGTYISWPNHYVTVNCDATSIEQITIDEQNCLEADFACWDCYAHQ